MHPRAIHTKVVEAAIKLQADIYSMASSAEQPGASSATSPAPQGAPLIFSWQAGDVPELVSLLSGRGALPADEYPYMARLATLGVKVVRKSRQKIYEEKVFEILKNMPKTEDLKLLPDYAEHEWLYRFLADKRDKAAGILIEGPEALELFCQEVRKCGEEDGEESSEEEWEEFWDEVRRKEQFLDECRRMWKEQGKTKEECRSMWPQALADWREKRKAADFDAMQM